MNSVKNEAEKLPDGWVLCKSKSIPGRKYYFNKKNGKSSWTQPQAGEKPGNIKKGKKEISKPEGNISNSKEDLAKKNLKRKSDGDAGQCSNKKKKLDASTPQKRASTSNKRTPEKAKNSANSRLEKLRAQLSFEVQNEENSFNHDQSPSKANKHKISPKNSLHDTPKKVPKMDSKSPNLNESKCSTTQSPSSDSLHSIPSPSQFFAATKIISSMKAQLPEEYSTKSKQKDMFADIEQGIYNQTPEYPSMKHPATPPQFSEASKIVSAMKSKLMYKSNSKEQLANETDVKTFSSAKERMAALKTCLSNDALNDRGLDVSRESCKVATPNCVQTKMEVEDFKETIPIASVAPRARRSSDSNKELVLVVDTNIFIHQLDVIKNVINSHIKGYKEQPMLLVPWRVVNELDKLKDNNNGHGAMVCKRAKLAMEYLYKSLPQNHRIKGQTLRDANSHIYPCELPDDEILNCCLQQVDRGKSVILLSNDKNLCNKATINSVKCIGVSQIKGLLESKPVEKMDPDLYTSVKHYETTMYQLLSNILENEMRAKYNNLWQHVLFKAPPWSLADVLQCLLKHWIAVFNEVFPRIEHLIADMKNTLASIQTKDPTTLSQSEVSNFKDICLDVARKCQIIPEYMELAKLTVDRLSNNRTSDSNEGDSELAVIDAFERVWTVFSSYCAKLSSSLGIAHGLEDKLPGNDPLIALTSKLHMFSSQISTFTKAIKDTLSTEGATTELISSLEKAFRDSLTLICMDSGVINRNNLRVFSTKCRNMLQEAYTKFAQLTELLEVCKSNIANM